MQTFIILIIPYHACMDNKTQSEPINNFDYGFSQFQHKYCMS